jgi:hypothetical protein
MLGIDHIKRSVQLISKLVDAQGSERDFEFVEHSTQRVNPGNYVLELTGKGSQPGQYSFRLRLLSEPEAGASGGQPQLAGTLHLRPGEGQFLDGTLSNTAKHRYEIVIEEPGGMLTLGGGKLDIVLPKLKLFDSQGSFLESSSLRESYHKDLAPGRYFLEITGDHYPLSGGHYMFRISLDPR